MTARGGIRTANTIERRDAYVPYQRVQPLMELWLHRHPEVTTRRFAAILLDQRFHRSRSATHPTGTPSRGALRMIERIIGGQQRRVQRWVTNAALATLELEGVHSERAASLQWSACRSEIERSLTGRTLVGADRIYRLGVLWKVRTHTPSSRRLAVILRERLREHGVTMSIQHLECALNGRVVRVRQRAVTVLEEFIREQCPGVTDISAALAGVSVHSEEALDLQWVSAKSIVTRARRWCAQHPGVTMRQLAIHIAEVARQMGFQPTSHHTVQAILNGHRRRTHQFILRATRVVLQEPHPPASNPPRRTAHAPNAPSTPRRDEGDPAVALDDVA